MRIDDIMTLPYSRIDIDHHRQEHRLVNQEYNFRTFAKKDVEGMNGGNKVPAECVENVFFPEIGQGIGFGVDGRRQ